VRNLLFVVHRPTCHEKADPSRKAVRDDSIFYHLNPVIPNPALSGEESVVACALLNAVATCNKNQTLALARRLEQKILELPADARVLIP
jgi:hypothetical protein